MPSAAQAFKKGAEYKFPDGSTAVWSGKGWVSAEDYLRMKGQSQSQFEDKRALMARLQRAQDKVNMFSTGLIGGLTEGIPGSPASSLKSDLAPIQSNEFISGTLNLRQNSPTGAGLGNQTEREGGKLESQTTGFDIGVPTKDMRFNLHALEDAYVRHTPGLSARNPIDLSTSSPEEIPQNAYFRAPDGRVYQNIKGAGYRPSTGARISPAYNAPRKAADPFPSIREGQIVEQGGVRYRRQGAQMVPVQ